MSGLLRMLVKAREGQAMVEYALVTAALMGGLTVMSFTFLPDFIEALQSYYNGFYILINLPVP